MVKDLPALTTVPGSNPSDATCVFLFILFSDIDNVFIAEVGNAVVGRQNIGHRFKSGEIFFGL